MILFLFILLNDDLDYEEFFLLLLYYCCFFINVFTFNYLGKIKYNFVY